MEVMEIGVDGVHVQSHVEVDCAQGLVNAIIQNLRTMENLASE